MQYKTNTKLSLFIIKETIKARIVEYLTQRITFIN